MAEGCFKCLKVLLSVVNLVFFLIGGAAIGFGAWILLQSQEAINIIDLETEAFDVPALLENGAKILIAVGSFVLLLSALGLCGACKGNRCMLIVYGVIVCLLVILQLTAVVLAAIFKERILDESARVLNATFVDSYEGDLSSGDEFSVLWDGYQITNQCCGVYNQEDFQYAMKWNHTAETVIPDSCCQFVDSTVFPDQPDKLVKVDPNCTTNPTPENAWIDKGCFHEIQLDLTLLSNIAIIVGCAILAIELICVVLAFCLCSALKKEQMV